MLQSESVRTRLDVSSRNTPATCESKSKGTRALVDELPRYNIALTQKLWAVTEANEERSLSLLQWGLIPSWSKEPTGFINARAETLEEKPSFMESFLKRRCLIPADGFYEFM